MARPLPPTEAQIEARLRRGEVPFPPLDLDWRLAEDGDADGILSLSWRDERFAFAAECKRQTTPKSLEIAADQARRRAEAARLLPLLVSPFLPERAIDALEARGVSGIDLCGNGLVLVPGRWYVRRTGAPNLFRAEGVIKNVYRRSSSTVARLFLSRPEFASLQDALDEVRRRGGRITLPTVSKVCKRLEDDLVVERKREDGSTRLRLIQPEKLLDLLGDNYSPPAEIRRLPGKPLGIDADGFRARLADWGRRTGGRIALTGTGSVGSYAAMARNAVEEYYCSDVAGLVRELGERFQVTDRFATVALIETPDEEVFFDRRDDLTASAVQTYLELEAGDKRDRETAEQVRKLILGPVEAPAWTKTPGSRRA